MEMISNILWLTLALAAYGFWRARGVHTKPGLGPRQTRMLIGAVAVGCAVTFLFPVISLTDDIRGEQSQVLKVSDGDLSTHKWRPYRHPNTKWKTPPLAPVLDSYFTSQDIFQAIIDQPETPVKSLAILGPPQGRSPPATCAR